MPFAHALRITAEVVRNVFAREELGEAASPDPGLCPKSGPSVAEMLFAIEALPVDPEPAPRARRGAARALFAPEPLGREAAPPRRPRRRGWLAWLFVPESLE